MRGDFSAVAMVDFAHLIYDRSLLLRLLPCVTDQLYKAEYKFIDRLLYPTYLVKSEHALRGAQPIDPKFEKVVKKVIENQRVDDSTIMRGSGKWVRGISDHIRF
jgi:hypothetical protein